MGNVPSWTASTDNYEVTGYRVERCQGAGCSAFAEIATTTAPSFNNTGLIAGTSYSYRVRATDAAGNLSPYSNGATVNTAASAEQVYYIHPDHLNTPRLIANQQGTTVWKWDQQEPFGSTPPNDNPSGLGAFEFPLRFPGQYFDKETNLSYNYFRDYDPAAGRYVESDLVGLKGGVNTYSFALENPIRLTDLLGLHVTFCYYPGFPTHIGFGVGFEGGTQGYYPKRHRSPRGPGIVKPDPTDEPTECKVVRTTPDQDRCMLDCRQRRIENPGTYNAATRQCTDFVRDCALLCKVPVGNNGGPLPAWFFKGIPDGSDE